MSQNALKMKTIDFEKTYRILDCLSVTAQEDLGGAATCYKGSHPILGDIVLLINGADGTGILIN